MTQEPDRATSGGNGAAVQGSDRSPMGMNELMHTFWRDEHGHLYRVHGTAGFGGDYSEVRLEWMPPSRQVITYRELKQRFLRENPPL